MPPKSVFTGKISALEIAYGYKYDFCRFYDIDGLIFSRYYGDIVIGEYRAEVDYDELAIFLSATGFSSVLCDENTGNRLKNKLNVNVKRDNLIHYVGNNPIAEIKEELSPTAVYAIIKDGFDIDYESWYPDMSHRIRHNVAKMFSYDNAASVTCQFCINKIAFLSQVATLKSRRGMGLGKIIVGSVAQKYKDDNNGVYLICRDEVLPFYKKIGFEKVGNTFTFWR